MPLGKSGRTRQRGRQLSSTVYSERRLNEFYLKPPSKIGVVLVSNVSLKPAKSNTQVPPSEVEVSVDWLAGSFPVENLSDVKVLVEQVTRSVFPDEYSGSRFYSRVYVNFPGAVLQTHPRAGHTTRCGLQMPGKVLSNIEPVDQLFLMKELASLGFNCSRIDICIDDYTKTITPERVKEAVDSRNQTGF